MGASCSSQSAIVVTDTSSPPPRPPPPPPPPRTTTTTTTASGTTTASAAVVPNEEENSFEHSRDNRWNLRRTNPLQRRNQQQLRDEARLAEIIALQQSLAAMEDFFQSLLGQIYVEAMDPQAGGSSGPPPIKEAALKELPRISTRQNCGICGEPCGDRGVQLPCGHVFHSQECIEPWLQLHCTCPVCRYELPTDDETFETGRLERMSARKLPSLEDSPQKIGIVGDRKDYDEQSTTDTDTTATAAATIVGGDVASINPSASPPTNVD